MFYPFDDNCDFEHARFRKDSDKLDCCIDINLYTVVKMYCISQSKD